LKKGLDEDPTNVRYMFYLAQSYKCVHLFEDSIRYYKKRIRAGGWDEEVWNSYYSIGECYLALNNTEKFEEYMQKAYKFRPTRAEPLYKMAMHFRIIGDHYKSYSYIKKGEIIPYPSDVLFVESFPHRGGFLYEKSIVEFYIHPEKCLKTSIHYLLKRFEYQDNVVSNLKFSVNSIPSTSTKLVLPNAFEGFTPSAISLSEYPMANVRYINYWIENGEYKTKEPTVQTENAYVNLETGEYMKLDDSSIELSRFPTNVKGLEDIRLYSAGGIVKFTATSVREYSESVCVVQGSYPYKDVRVLSSPFGIGCEKNWLPISNTNMFIYGWNPYRLVDEKSSVIKQIETPPFFSTFRGSCPPIKVDEKYWCMVHFIEHSKIRIYYHCLVELSKTLEPKRLTYPFTFRSNAIEYCVSMRFDTELECYVSFMDKEPHKIRINPSEFMWISI